VGGVLVGPVATTLCPWCDALCQWHTTGVPCWLRGGPDAVGATWVALRCLLCAVHFVPTDCGVYEPGWSGVCFSTGDRGATPDLVRYSSP